MAKTRKTNYTEFAKTPAAPEVVIPPTSTEFDHEEATVANATENQNEVSRDVIAIVNAKHLNQRKDPRITADIMGVLSPADDVVILGTANRMFYKVDTRLGIGFCMKKFLDLAE